MLFLATLVVTFPSLYVTSAIGRSRLGVRATLGLLLTVNVVMCTALASLGTITVFFTLSTTSYPFS